MDSITQAALGGAIGEAFLGRKVGNKAILWGIVVGTLPDLDVIVNPLIDEVTALTVHRGYSHSILVNLATAPILGWVLHKIHPHGATLRDWIVMAVVCLQAAILLDAFTVYGTQLLQPFSNYPVGFNSISIIDPLITLPLLVGIIGVLFCRRESKRRRWLNRAGLILGIGYLALTLPVKAHVNTKAESYLADEGITYSRYMTGPSLGNIILWRYMADVDSGFVIGYHSLADTGEMEPYTYIPKNDSLLNPIRETRAVEVLDWFSQGYYIVRSRADGLYLSDLRFGELVIDPNKPPVYIFTWQLYQDEDGEWMFRQQSPAGVDAGRAFGNMFERMRGK